MLYWLIPLSILGFFLIAALVAASICFFRIFYNARKGPREEYPTPKGELYDPYRPQMIQ